MTTTTFVDSQTPIVASWLNDVDQAVYQSNSDISGSTPRTLISKLSDFVSVLDFIPESEHAAIKALTSTYDCTAAFQAAADIGGQIFVPNGLYIIDYVTLPTNCVWIGEGVKSCIRKKANSVSQSYVKESYLFSPEKFNLSIAFENLLLDGNYTEQVTTRTGERTCNHSLVQSNTPDLTATKAGVGGWFSSIGVTPTASSDRLIVRFTNCRLYRAMTDGVYIDSEPDIGAYAQLIFQGNDCYGLGPSIIEYHDGVSAYDGIVYPASGYSWIVNGITATVIRATDGAHVNVTNSTFKSDRDPFAGGATTGYDWNVYNLPAVGVVQTILSGTTDVTPEWGSLNVANNYFEGMGRTYVLGNGIGVIDMYARGGPGSIVGNTFRNCWESPIRGKTSILALAVTGNVIETVYNGGFGINIGPNTYPSQKGNYTITGNSIRGAGAGIMVTGNISPPENSDPSIPDDTNTSVDNVVIADNTIEDIVGPIISNPVLSAALASYGWGIQVRYASSVAITGNIIKNITGTSAAQNEHGIFVRNCIDQLVVGNNVITNVTRYGIDVLSHAGKVTITSNSVVNTGSGGIFCNNAGKSIVTNNLVDTTGSTGIIAGTSVATSAVVSGNIVRNVVGNTTSTVYGIDNGGMPSGEYVLTGNIIESVSNSNTGYAYGARIQFATLSDQNSFTMADNTIDTVEEGGVFLQGANGVISNNYFKSIATNGSTAYGAFLINGIANIGLVQLNNNRVASDSNPFPTTGSATADTMRNNGRISETGNSWQAQTITRSAAPTAGTWKVGDIVWNSAPTIGGASGWVCTAAGTPGTWTVAGTTGVVSVKTFGAVGDGTIDDTAKVQSAVTYCYTTGAQLLWPEGTYLTSASISNFHDVKHIGAGVVKRGTDLWTITPDRTTVRKLYCSPSGSNTNDGLSASQPRASIQSLVNVVDKYGPIVGRQQIIGAAGTYAEKVTLPDGLAQENNYLEFRFPTAPGVRGDPSSWPVGGAILDGTSLTGDGFSVGRYNKVYIEYLLVQNWYDTGLGATQQVVSGITVDEFSLLYTYGVSAQGNGWNNLYVKPCGAAVITGGILDGARYGVNNTAGRLSMTANGSTYTTVRNALEYGLYAKHNSSSVLDYTEFANCGQVTGAETYGSALFAYKSGTSIDTRNCTFNQNNIVYHSRSGGHIATEIPSTDTLGTGGDANDRIWKVEGFGNNDAINYRSIAGRDLAQVFTIATTTSTTTATVIDNICTVPAEYFQNADQYMEIEIYGSASTQAATVRPTWTSSAPTNYGFGVFSVAANTEFKIKLLIYPTGASSQFIQFENIGATSSGATLSDTTSTGVFGTSPMTFKVRGEVISGGTLEIKRVRVVLWG